MLYKKLEKKSLIFLLRSLILIVFQLNKIAVFGFLNRKFDRDTNNMLAKYNTILYNIIQYNTILYNTIQYNTKQYNTIQ